MDFQTYEKCDKVYDRIELNGKIRLFVPTLQEKKYNLFFDEIRPPESD